MARMIGTIGLVLCTLFALKGQSNDFETRYQSLLDSLHAAQDYTQPLANMRMHWHTLRDSIRSSDTPLDLRRLIPYIEWMDQHHESTPALIRKLYTHLGYDLNRHAAIDEAILCYQRAHQYGLKMDALYDYWYVENPLGSLFNIKGDHEQALYYYEYTRKGLEELLRHPSTTPAELNTYSGQWERLLNNIGYLYYWNRDYEQALTYLHKSDESARQSGNLKARLFSARFIIEVYTALKQYEEALHKLDQYAAMIATLPASARQEEQVLFHQLSGLVFLAMGHCQSAVSHLQKTVSDASLSARYVAKNHERLARAFLACGQPDSAILHIRQGLVRLHLDWATLMARDAAVYEENTIVELMATACTYFRERHSATEQNHWLDSARIAATIALETLDMLREQYLLEDSKFISLESTRELIEQIVELIHLQPTSASTTKAAEAWPYFVQSKNVLLSDYDWERKALASLPPEKRDLLREQHQRILQLTSKQMQAADPQEAPLIAGELLLLRKGLRQALDGAGVLREAPKPAKSPFIEYLFTKEGLFAMDNLRGTLRMSKLPHAGDIDSLVRAVQAGMKSRDDRPAFYEALHHLYRYLLTPFEPLPPAFTVFPDGPLFLLPFPALIRVPEERRYLVLDHSMNIGYTHAPPGKRRSGMQLHAMAPDYPEVNNAYAVERGNLYHLPFADREISGVMRHWQGPATAHTDLDKTTFFRLLAEGGQLHFAGHALVKAGAAWLALSADSSQWVTFQEISRASSTARGVVLSACETGLGRYAHGEGVNSLAKSFLHAGVQSVVYSLWTVNDQTTAILMDHYYRRLRAQKHAAKALTLAQRDYLLAHSGPHAHPYYWAAFVAAEHGDPGLVVPAWLWVALTGVLITIFILLAHKLFKR